MNFLILKPTIHKPYIYGPFQANGASELLYKVQDSIKIDKYKYCEYIDPYDAKIRISISFIVQDGQHLEVRLI